MNIIDGPATQNFSNRPASEDIVKQVIVHSMGEVLRWGGSTCTAGEMLTLKTPPSTWTEQWSRVSAHYYITPAGAIHRVLSPDMKAWHAGVSEWSGENNLNNTAVGFELLVPGTHDYSSFVNAIQHDCFSAAQYDAASWLTAQLMLQYRIGLQDVRGHSEVSGDAVRGDGKGKIDPGSGFDWRRFYGGVGWYLFREQTTI